MKTSKTKVPKKFPFNAKDPVPKKGQSDNSGPRPSDRKPKGQRPEAIQAGVAAMARNTGNPVLRILSSREILEKEARKKKTENLAVDGVYFRCPHIGPQVLSRNQWKETIKKHLYDQLKKDKIITPCVIVKTLNGLEATENCVTGLQKYLENIIKDPDEPKYRQIRVKNKFFQENVYKAAGGLEFLESAGFKRKVIKTDKGEEEFLVVEGTCQTDRMELLLDALKDASPIRMEIDRNIQVLKIEQALQRTNLPDDFYRLKPEEIKKEQQQRAKAITEAEVLKTKAMRDSENKKLAKTYNYTIVRVRFPDSEILQGTFGSLETFSEVKKLVEDSLLTVVEYSIRTPLGHRLEGNEEGRTLAELGLVPTSLLTFVCEGLRGVKKFLRADLPRMRSEKGIMFT